MHTKEEFIAKRQKTWQIFDSIAPTYDVLNRILSCGQDVLWRNRLAKFLPNKPDLHVLDLATGTADVILSLFKKSKRIKTAIGIDMSEKMLEIGRQKIEKKKLADVVSLQTEDATQLSFPENQFDAATMSFGIRNVENTEAALREIHRVLKPQGRAVIMEFAIPTNWLIRKLYLLYFRQILPRVGAMISGNKYAYSYLNETAETFPAGEDFCRLMEEAGFSEVKATPLTFGIAYIYQGEKA